MTDSANVSASPDSARAIAAAAYIYAYPMLDNYATWFKQAVDPDAPEYVGGFGQFRHYSEPSTPKNHDVVTPNNDTPYSWAWLDLRAEPWVLSVPEVPSGRYYVSQWVDLFTYNFAYVGSRTTGNGAGHYLFAGPRWDGETPTGIDKVFKAETDIVGTLTRTQLDGPEDVPAVRAVQAGLTLQPLSAFLGQPARSTFRPTTRNARIATTSSSTSTSCCSSPSRRIRARSNCASVSRPSASDRNGPGTPRRWTRPCSRRSTQGSRTPKPPWPRSWP